MINSQFCWTTVLLLCVGVEVLDVVCRDGTLDKNGFISKFLWRKGEAESFNCLLNILPVKKL